MKKHFRLIAICLFLNSCLNENSNITKTHSNDGQDNILKDTVYVKKWLSKVIIAYVNNENKKIADKNLKYHLTKDYYNYKSEAITLEYSDMSIEDFNDKWKSKYNTRYVGHGGFFTYVMDNGHVV